MMDQDNHSQDKHNLDASNNNEVGADLQSHDEHVSEDRPPIKRRPPVVLKFKKRIYDGGNEAELIRTMERHYRDVQFAETRHGEKEADGLSDAERERQERLQALKPLVEAAEAADRPYLRVVGSKPQAPVQNVTPLPLKPPVESTPAAPKLSPKRQAVQAILLGPLEISVSILGMITATFALLTFAYFKNQELNNHSRTVLKECKRTFVRGIKNCLTGPIKALRCLTGQEVTA